MGPRVPFPVRVTGVDHWILLGCWGRLRPVDCLPDGGVALGVRRLLGDTARLSELPPPSSLPSRVSFGMARARTERRSAT
jgi:hypothetical protein